VGIQERWLVHRLRRGERDAAEELVRRTYRGIYGYLRHLGAGGQLAEDLTQATFARAWANLSQLRKGASLRSWLLTIARNEYLQFVRRPAREIQDPEAGSESIDPSPGALDLLEEADRDQRLRLAVHGLEPPLAEAVVLHYFQGLSLRQAASVQGIPVGTMKSRIHQALGHLRAHLEKKEIRHVRSGA
jgi:RNA polymerase sigma-70 factor, ECF subfamily